MKHQPIHTKYHKLREATPTLDLNGVATGPDYLDMINVQSVLQGLDKLPRYVIDSDLISMVIDPNGKMHKSLTTMIESGIARLPFEEVMIEFDAPTVLSNGDQVINMKTRQFVVVAERGSSVEKFSAVNWALVEFPGHYPLVAIPPFVAAVDLVTNRTLDSHANRKDIETAAPFTDGQDCGGVFRSARSFLLKRSVPDSLISKWLDNGQLVGHSMTPVVTGLSALVVLLRTRGIVQEKIEAPIKLNKSRQQSGKAPITDHTVIKIGHVYNRAGEKITYNKTDRTMPVHWRAGHWRNQAFGPGRSRHYDLFIEPMLINYVEGEDKPTPKVKEMRP